MKEKTPRMHIRRSRPEHIPPASLRAAAVMPQQCRDGVPSDVNGSYTGTPMDYTQPEQDADDI